jgi:hypothetical protein
MFSGRLFFFFTNFKLSYKRELKPKSFSRKARKEKALRPLQKSLRPWREIFSKNKNLFLIGKTISFANC